MEVRNSGIDHYRGKGFRDYFSENEVIQIREVPVGEVRPFVFAEYWHLNRSFAGRSVFYGSGIKPFMDNAGRFLVLRDAKRLLLFDYLRGECWNTETNRSFVEVSFLDDSLAPGRLGEQIPFAELDHHLDPGLGDSVDGFLSHWKPKFGKENLVEVELSKGSVFLKAD